MSHKLSSGCGPWSVVSHFGQSEYGYPHPSNHGGSLFTSVQRVSRTTSTPGGPFAEVQQEWHLWQGRFGVSFCNPMLVFVNTQNYMIIASPDLPRVKRGLGPSTLIDTLGTLIGTVKGHFGAWKEGKLTVYLISVFRNVVREQ